MRMKTNIHVTVLLCRQTPLLKSQHYNIVQFLFCVHKKEKKNLKKAATDWHDNVITSPAIANNRLAAAKEGCHGKNNMHVLCD